MDLTQYGQISLTGGCIVAIATLWKMHSGRFNTLEKKLDHCEQKHEDAYKEITDLKTKNAELQTRLDILGSFSPIDIAAKVVEAITKLLDK